MDLAKKSGRSREEPPNDFKNSRELTKKIIHQSLVLGSTILKFILRIKMLTLCIFLRSFKIRQYRLQTFRTFST